MVFSEANVDTRIMLGSSLANYNVACLAVWPPKSFTPNRLLSESRPLRELPAPFLCAIILYFYLLKVSTDYFLLFGVFFEAGFFSAVFSLQLFLQQFS